MNDEVFITDGIRFIKSPVKTKKYRALLKDGYVDFGAIKNGVPMAQYHDRISKTYSDYDHLDEERRARYYYRFNKDYGKYSADWFSKKFLW